MAWSANNLYGGICDREQIRNEKMQERLDGIPPSPPPNIKKPTLDTNQNKEENALIQQRHNPTRGAGGHSYMSSQKHIIP
jgi:hypothetical protein